MSTYNHHRVGGATALGTVSASRRTSHPPCCEPVDLVDALSQTQCLEPVEDRDARRGSISATGRCRPHEPTLNFIHAYGSVTVRPSRRISKCRCGPVLLPVLPTWPTSVPAVTTSPTAKGDEPSIMCA